MLKITKKLTNYKKAFTLIEALVAISILMIAIASPMMLAQKGLSTATLSKDQMVATFLVQDAIESVKNIRDQIAMRGGVGDWLNNTLLKDCICTNSDNCNFDSSNPTYCAMDTVSSEWKAGNILSNNPTPPGPLMIEYNASGNFLKYDYNPKNLSSCGVSNPGECSEASKFTRYINIKKTGGSVDGENEAVVSVRVSWNSPQGPQKIDIQNFIYNYSENFE